MTLLNLISDELENYEDMIVWKIYQEFQWNYDTKKVFVLWQDREKRLIKFHEIDEEDNIDWRHPIIYDLKQATLENTWNYEIENEELD